MTWLTMTIQPVTDVWIFETAEQEDYSHFLGEYIEETVASKDEEDMALIRSFWDDEYDWDTIVERASVEGSTWYVWWMDGVRRYMMHEGCGRQEG
jgi:asparagine synthetase A